MKDMYKLDEENDEILLIDTPDDEYSNSPSEYWKIIVADDDEEVHRVTKLVLNDISFEGKGISILSAYSEQEVKSLFQEHDDVAMIFLDVIMEKDDSGFNVVKYIRNELKNNLVRIILRTGQPGQAPEEQTIINYDINDYKEKTELTSTKLFTCVITALRSYRDIVLLENNKKGLEKVIGSTAEVFKPLYFNNFFDMFLKGMISIIEASDNVTDSSLSSFIASNSSGDSKILSATGAFSHCVGQNLQDVFEPEIFELVQSISDEKKITCLNNHFFAYFTPEYDTEIMVYIQKAHNFTQVEQDLLSIFCTNTTIAFNNRCLANEIESTQKEIILTLGGIAEARSKETGQHVLRVAEFSKVLALGYGLSPDESEIIKQAAPMHDIGKIAIPDEILNKPGKLTAEEFEVMKTHSQVGYDLLKNSKRSIIKTAAIIALQHHEKFDGTGYPQKLSGNNIHIYGRITAIADVFDALGCERVYKKAWELEKILDLFKQERGRHFDPVLIDIFFQNLDKILEIRKSFPDDRA